MVEDQKIECKKMEFKDLDFSLVKEFESGKLRIIYLFFLTSLYGSCSLFFYITLEYTKEHLMLICLLETTAKIPTKRTTSCKREMGN